LNIASGYVPDKNKTPLHSQTLQGFGFIVFLVFCRKKDANNNNGKLLVQQYRAVKICDWK
jgi:hypothetical protein